MKNFSFANFENSNEAETLEFMTESFNVLKPTGHVMH